MLDELLAGGHVVEESTLRSTFGVMAIHGGGLERTTDVVARSVADRAGASDIQVQVSRNDRTAIAGGDELFLESRIEATAVGRPRLAHDRPRVKKSR